MVDLGDLGHGPGVLPPESGILTSTTSNQSGKSVIILLYDLLSARHFALGPIRVGR